MIFEKYLVEFTGTLLFVYVVLTTQNPIAIGAVLALILLLSTKISIGYMNPAITIVMSSLGKIHPSEVLPYCLAQVLGGLVAIEIYKKCKQ
jgi:glycerol uptake facilitator-like aquaporin